MKVMTIVGARPEFIQTAPVTKALRARQHTEILVHTGQHYDVNMSNVFFADLHLPTPDYHLGVGSGTHAEQTGEMLIKLEMVMMQEHPDWVIVYGDTNSTVAGALAAAKIHIPVAHIEAGLRSYDRKMPEEINRVMTDHLSDVLLAPTTTAVENLAREGITKHVHLVGDVRVDLLLTWAAEDDDQITRYHAPFALATIHRASNTDDPARLACIVAALNDLALPVVLPAHPRLAKMLKSFDLAFSDNVRVIEPQGYRAMIGLLIACDLVITDSGGLQKEAYMLSRPTVTLRDTTEWVETIEAGWNRLCEPEDLHTAVEAARHNTPAAHPDLYGSIGVAERICDVLEAAR